MMTGPDSAKKFVCDYLKHDLPTRLVAYRNFWNCPEEDLMLPNGYRPYAPPSFEHLEDDLPIIYTVILSTDSLRRIDYTAVSDPVYRVTYNTRSYILVRHVGIEVTTRARDRTMTVVRAAMLDRQCLTVAATHENTEVKFDENSMREDFSDVIPQKGERYAAAGYLSYQLTIDEVVTRPTLGIVEEFDVTAINGPRFLVED
jgi:hypothetical protein